MTAINQEIINRYQTFLIEEEKSKNTIDKYLRDIRSFFEWVGERELCKQMVLAYKEQMLADGYAPRSVNSKLSSLNSLFEFCHLYHLKVKMLKIQRQIFSDCERELTVREYERLLSAAKRKGNEQLELLMQTICATGIRVSEDIYCKG